MTATTKVSSKIQMQVNTECISPQLHTTAEHQRNRHKWPEVHDYCVSHSVSLHLRQSVIRTAVWCRVMRSQLRCVSHPHRVLGTSRDLVLGMLVIGQRRNVKQRIDIVHALVAHEGVSVDDGDGLGVARLVSHLRKPFHDRIVPPSMCHIVAARSPIAGTGFDPRLGRQSAMIGLSGLDSLKLSRRQCCRKELRPLRSAQALCRLLTPGACNSVAERRHIQVPLRIVAGRRGFLQFAGFRTKLISGLLARTPVVALQSYRR